MAMEPATGSEVAQASPVNSAVERGAVSVEIVTPAHAPTLRLATRAPDDVRVKDPAPGVFKELH